ncbi:MAG: sulfite exporter TauE/SafE family protein [Pseudomonadota bacterium]
MEISYFAAFLAGLLGGVHCVGMCGGIVGALSFSLDNQTPPKAQLIMPFLLAYNSGRLLSYTIAGALLGGISMLASNLVAIQNAQLVLQSLAAILMLLLGLYLAGWWHGINKIEQLGTHLWKKIEPFSRKYIPVKHLNHAFLLGIFWGWLPCGLVYTLLFWSISSASMVDGALIMLCFGLGTLPTLLAMGVFATSLSSFVHNSWVRQIAGATLIAFAIYTLLNLSTRFT